MNEPPSVTICPACGQGPGALLHHIDAAPTTDVELFKSQAAARGVSQAPIELNACSVCGFAWNGAFDPALVTYHQGFESTQIHSPTFRTSLQALIEQLVTYLPEGDGPIVEAGCGQGELITALSQAAGRRAIGIDPAYRGDEKIGQVTFRSEHFDAASLAEKVDLIVCKMTLEHIWQPLELVSQFARALSQKGRVFIQVPRFEQAVLDDAYWDIYYEHCNYFSEASLTGLGARAGLHVERLWQEYQGQYVLGMFSRGDQEHLPEGGMSMDRYREFAQRIDNSVNAWRAWLGALTTSGRKVALWGGGSKAVSFMTHLDDCPGIVAAIDINPDKRNSFLPGSGLPVIGPEDAARRELDGVILMNPVYREEVSRMLEDQGMGDCRLLDIAQPPAEGSG